jgi:hypothetical protein
MTKLTQEQIQFIDIYLKKSDVIYDDIRLEMVDHVAAAIETELMQDKDKEFYDVFKAFMVKHKKELLDSNKKFIKKSLNKVGRCMLKNAWSKNGILILVALCISLYILNILLDTKNFYRVFVYAPLGIVLISFLGIKCYRINRKPFKFSAINQLGLYGGLIYYFSYTIFNPFNSKLIKNMVVNEFYFSVLVMLLFTSLIFMYTAFQLSKSYAEKYRFITE